MVRKGEEYRRARGTMLLHGPLEELQQDINLKPILRDVARS